MIKTCFSFFLVSNFLCNLLIYSLRAKSKIHFIFINTESSKKIASQHFRLYYKFGFVTITTKSAHYCITFLSTIHCFMKSEHFNFYFNLQLNNSIVCNIIEMSTIAKIYFFKGDSLRYHKC